MKKGKAVSLIIDVLAVGILVYLDQVWKRLAVLHLKGQEPFVLIDGVLELRYLENQGAAFGMLQNKKALFIFMTVIMLTVVLYVLVKLPRQKKFGIWQVFLCCICAGGIGNMLDRVRLDYVVDYIYISLIDFPIFNFADVLITIGTVLLFVEILFFVKEDELKFLKFNIRKDKE